MPFSPLFYLLALTSSIYSLEDHYIITRLSSDGLTNEEDVFDVPESQCTSVAQCYDYINAESSSTGPSCRCRCLPHASTFGCHGGSWYCLNNTEMRKQSGCRLRFTSDRDEDPFRILKLHESPLPSAILPSDSCSIDMSSSKYFTCDGKWAEIDPNGRTSSPLLIFIKEKLSNSRHYKYIFMVQNRPSLNGKLVSLQFKCPQRLQPSCLVFKMEGEFECPASVPKASSTTTKPVVKPTTSFIKPTEASGAEEKEEKGKAASNQGGTASGTVAAVVTTVIIVILLVVFIGFVIWKRKKGERLQIIDRLTRLGRKKQLEPDENMYAEIAQKSNQRPTRTGTETLNRGIDNCGFSDFSSSHSLKVDDSIYAEAEFTSRNEPVADVEGYLVPADSPMYLELQPPQENMNGKSKSENEGLNSVSDSDVESSGSHFYDVLEDPNEQNMNKTSSREGDTREESFRGSAGSGIVKVAPRSSHVPGSNEPAPKERRRPPSPPRAQTALDEVKNHDRLTIHPDNHGEIAGKELDLEQEDNVYESLQDDERAMPLYEPLDRKTVFKH